MGYTTPALSTLERTQIERVITNIMLHSESSDSDSSSEDEEMPDVMSDSSSDSDSEESDDDADLAFFAELLD